MEHILQIAVGVDDEAIQKKIEDACVNGIRNQVDAYGEYRYGYKTSELTEMFKNEIKLLIDARSDEIIEKAVNILASSLTRTKKVKAALDDMLTEVNDD